MKCEFCNRTMKQGDILHGVKHGRLTTTGFKSDRDAAVTVICGPCGNIILNVVHAKYDPAKPSYPALYRVYEELTACMKNGYKLIQAISKLPSSDIAAIKRLTTIYKQAN